MLKTSFLDIRDLDVNDRDFVQKFQLMLNSFLSDEIVSKGRCIHYIQMEKDFFMITHSSSRSEDYVFTLEDIENVSIGELEYVCNQCLKNLQENGRYIKHAKIFRNWDREREPILFIVLHHESRRVM